MVASKQASKQVHIHTHMHNAVLLVWGSLRFALMRVGGCLVVTTQWPEHWQLESGFQFPVTVILNFHCLLFTS